LARRSSGTPSPTSGFRDFPFRHELDYADGSAALDKVRQRSATDDFTLPAD
jgi:hypothetical protein